MKKVLVTGGSGFIGQNLMQVLNRSKYEIHSLSRRNAVSDVINHKADLFDTAEISKLVQTLKPDVLIHMAWNVENSSYWHSIDNNSWTIASIFLAEQFFKNGGNYFIFAGTSASYDYTKGLLSENSKMEYPDSLYGISKWYASQVIQKIAISNHGKFLETRIFSVFGDYERSGRLVSNTIRSLMHGEKVVNCKWPLERDYIYIKDAVRAIAHLVDNEINGIYNISSGKAVTIKRIVTCIAEQLGKKDLLYFDIPQIENEILYIVGDSRKLLDTGFEYKYTLEKAISETIGWYRE